MALGRLRYRWEDNIKIDFREMGWGIWTGFMWLRMQTSVSHEHSSVPYGSINWWEFLECLSIRE
jgi:hypothetical protein